VGPTWRSWARRDFVRQRYSARPDTLPPGIQKEYICGRPNDTKSKKAISMNKALQERSAQQEDRLAAGERSGFAAIAAGGLAAILASACCLGPLVLVLLGISGAWIGDLTRLEPYRPIFLLLSAVALFFAGRQLFRQAGECQSETACAPPKARLVYKILFIAAVMLTLISVILPYAAEYLF